MNQLLEFDETDVDGASLAEVCRRYSVKELSLFGSSIRGELRPESDIDVMVEFEPGVRVGPIKFESLVEELAALAGRRVDWVTKRGLRHWVRPGVLRGVFPTAGGVMDSASASYRALVDLTNPFYSKVRDLKREEQAA
jgi:hypothetical protein